MWKGYTLTHTPQHTRTHNQLVHDTWGSFPCSFLPIYRTVQHRTSIRKVQQKNSQSDYLFQRTPAGGYSFLFYYAPAKPRVINSILHTTPETNPPSGPSVRDVPYSVSLSPMGDSGDQRHITGHQSDNGTESNHVSCEKRERN